MSPSLVKWNGAAPQKCGLIRDENADDSAEPDRE